jgi:Transglycosylase SLT domain
MFNFRPNLQRIGLYVEPAEEEVPGLHTWRPKEEVTGLHLWRPAEEVPGLHAWRPKEEVLGFHMNANGSGRQTAEPAAQPRTDVSGNPFGPFDLYGVGHDAFAAVGDGSPPPYLGRWPTGSAPSFGPAPAGLIPPDAGPSSQSSYTSFGHTAGPTPPSSSNLPTPPFVAAHNAWPAVDRTDDPNIVRAADIQVAQNQPPPSRTGRQVPPPSPTHREPPPPGRGYVQGQQDRIERGMTPLQVRISRDQAFRELTRQPLDAEQARSALRDDWETTKPADLVDEIKRAAERHGVPVQMFARQLFQEGKFNESDKLKRPLLMDSPNLKVPLSYPQMTKGTFQDLRRRALQRGDTKRAQELATYSLANREQSFDAAAEHLAYLHRLMGGSWPKALAAYNYGVGIKDWFDGKPMSIGTKKWEEIAGYLAYALRGAPEDPQMGDGYVYQAPNRAHAREWIHRPDVYSDTRLNP